MCHLFVGLEDEQVEREGNRFRSRLPPIQKNKYGPVQYNFFFLPFFYALFICRHLSLGNYYEGIVDAVTFEYTQKPRACGEKESYIGGQDVLEPTKFHIFICKEDSCH